MNVCKKMNVFVHSAKRPANKRILLILAALFLIAPPFAMAAQAADYEEEIWARRGWAPPGSVPLPLENGYEGVYIEPYDFYLDRLPEEPPAGFSYDDDYLDRREDAYRYFGNPPIDFYYDENYQELREGLYGPDRPLLRFYYDKDYLDELEENGYNDYGYEDYDWDDYDYRGYDRDYDYPEYDYPYYGYPYYGYPEYGYPGHGFWGYGYPDTDYYSDEFLKGFD